MVLCVAHEVGHEEVLDALVGVVGQLGEEVGDALMNLMSWARHCC